MINVFGKVVPTLTVVCILDLDIISVRTTLGNRKLYLGRKYEVEDGSVSGNPRSYWIRFDSGEVNTISKRYFKLIEEVRNDKLKELGI